MQCSYSTTYVNGFTCVMQDTRNMEELVVRHVIGDSTMSFENLEVGRYVVTVLPELHSLFSSPPSAMQTSSTVVHSEIVVAVMEPSGAGEATFNT